MLTYLAQFENIFGPLRLLRFGTMRTLLAAITAMVLGFMIGPWLITRLRRLKFGDVADPRTGDLAQRFDKKNTPTMGGLLISGSVILSCALWAEPNVWVVVALFVYAALTLVGFRDDYLKVVRKSKDGISSREKMFWQTLITAVALLALALNPQSANKIRELWLPFVKNPVVIFPAVWWGLGGLFVLMFLWVVGFSNAINLTDGLDGLAAGCTVTVTMSYGIMAYAAGHKIIAEYLLISHVPGVGELTVVCGALIGACIAFLWFNSHPAEVFMGDTGSLALGGLIGIMAFMVHQPATLAIIGGVFVAEALSVIIQVSYFKATKGPDGVGKRFFRMAPIHHHFQKLGWPETKVVARFWILSLICALAGLSTLKLR
jgi:phospho-N-acetylmuramoyl-pentapeptide-transferase